jgi:hypothetical protein
MAAGGLVPVEVEDALVAAGVHRLAVHGEGPPALSEVGRVLADQRSDIHLPIGVVMAQMGKHGGELDGIAQPVAEAKQDVRRGHCWSPGFSRFRARKTG